MTTINRTLLALMLVCTVAAITAGCNSDDESDNFAATCLSDADCADGPADYCMGQPGQDGSCTYTGCSDGDCPTGFKCCDCTGNTMGLEMPVFCIDEGPNHQFMITNGGCTCEI